MGVGDHQGPKAARSQLTALITTPEGSGMMERGKEGINMEPQAHL